jgi:hypothetical protein
MANKVASVLVALAILATAFLLIPDPVGPGAPTPAAAPDAPDAPVVPGPPAVPPELAAPAPPPGEMRETPADPPITDHGGEKVITTCQTIVQRLEKLGGADFSQNVGDALHAKLTADDVVALCGRLGDMDDAALLAEVKTQTGIAP